MFFDCDIRADRLPEKTLCLTYDDGPGPQTVELAQYLFEQGISAAFFTVGSHAQQQPDVPGQLAEWGHIIGNHTHTHPGLAAMADLGGDVAGEVLKADEALRACTGGRVRFFRAPYGSWREVHRSADGAAGGARSLVAQQLNQVPTLAHYTGHIHWDICTCDYDFWRSGASSEDCSEFCMREICRVGKGIVLLHDSSEDPQQRPRNRTWQVTERIVPWLKAQGFRFVRLDQIPQVQSAMRSTQLATLELDDGRSLCLFRHDAAGFRAVASDVATTWGLVPLDGDFCALRAPNGCYLSARRDFNSIIEAHALTIGGDESFRLEQLSGESFLMRTRRGGYWAPQSEGECFCVHADALSPRRASLKMKVHRFGWNDSCRLNAAVACR
ncbi:MAG TPA: polysaccharide deacetylase family protein [Planctomycetaceae bacterium]|nr:polysaccharide deacetylase family protein [Planctomycetaceae bacterium]